MNSYDEDIKPTYIKWEDVQSMKAARDLYEELNPQTATEKQMECEALRKGMNKIRRQYEEKIKSMLLPVYTTSVPHFLTEDELHNAFYGTAPRKKRSKSAPRPKKALLNMLSCLLDKDE